VGIGPGCHEDMTLRADRALRSCDVIVGYTVYLDLIAPHYPDKEYFSTPIPKEGELGEAAIDLARRGKTVCMVCSGDSGVYGMAALVLALRGEQSEPEIEIIPGITAACSGAALLGAPLTHDFAVISLSDRLTPWEAIEKRLLAAAKADLSIVLYNPASRGRPEHLRKACELLLRELPQTRVCGIARNIGRDGETHSVLTLGELRNARADMFCTVFIGNSQTKIVNRTMVTPRGYQNV
jgi:precorrin-3B C17-methyltransferase